MNNRHVFVSTLAVVLKYAEYVVTLLAVMPVLLGCSGAHVR